MAKRSEQELTPSNERDSGSTSPALKTAGGAVPPFPIHTTEVEGGVRPLGWSKENKRELFDLVTTCLGVQHLGESKKYPTVSFGRLPQYPADILTWLDFIQCNPFYHLGEDAECKWHCEDAECKWHWDITDAIKNTWTIAMAVAAKQAWNDLPPMPPPDYYVLDGGYCVYSRLFAHEQLNLLRVYVSCKMSPITGMPPQVSNDKPTVDFKGKAPSDEALMAYRLHAHLGGKQTETAKLMTKELRRKINQSQVSRWLKQCDKAIAAGFMLPNSPGMNAKPTTMSPDDIDLGPRQDGRTPRQRATRSGDSYNGD